MHGYCVCLVIGLLWLIQSHLRPVTKHGSLTYINYYPPLISHGIHLIFYTNDARPIPMLYLVLRQTNIVYYFKNNFDMTLSRIELTSHSPGERSTTVIALMYYQYYSKLYILAKNIFNLLV